MTGLIFSAAMAAAVPAVLPPTITLSADETEALIEADKFEANLQAELVREATAVAEKAVLYRNGVFQAIWQRRGRPEGYQVSQDRRRLEKPTPTATAVPAPTPTPPAKAQR